MQDTRSWGGGGRGEDDQPQDISAAVSHLYTRIYTKADSLHVRVQSSSS